MKSETEQIISTLEILSQGLVYSCVGDEPYIPFIWETDLQGEFSLETFLRSNDSLVSFPPEKFFQEIKSTQPKSHTVQYEELFSFLEDQLTNLETFSYFVPELPDGIYGSGEFSHHEINIPVILGATTQGEWLGLMLRQYDRNSNSHTPVLLPPQLVSQNYSSNEILTRVNQITAKLPYQSKGGINSIYGSPLWVASLTDDRNTILERVLYDAVTLSYGNIDSFCRIGDDFEESSSQAQKLSRFFKVGLTSSRVYEIDFNFGESYCVYYCLGQVPNQDWVGLVTVSYTC
jgi:Nuclease A inhibitor-like protein